MSTIERPGVYTSYEVSGGLSGSGGGGAVALAAAADAGEPGVVVTVTDDAAARSAFEGGNMTELVHVLLENGASEVRCCAVEEGDYATAFAALMAQEHVSFMVCDSRSAVVHALLLSAIENADEKSKYRIGVVESAETTRAGLVSAAQALNSERMALVSHSCADGAPGLAAAAVCGLLAGETDPAVPLNGAQLQGVGDIGDNFSDGDLELLVRGGVLPLETLGGRVSVVRGITTRSSTAGAADATWRELTTVRIIDTVLPSIRDTLHAAFARCKNTAQTRGAIRTRTVIELERFLRQEIIDDYADVTATASEDDPTVCVVSFRFGVAHGLNVIRLSARITV